MSSSSGVAEWEHAYGHRVGAGEPREELIAWLALTAAAAHFVPDRQQPQPIAYTPRLP